MLRQAGLRSPDDVVLSGVDASIRDRAVTVLLGPGGTGKSLFLRALSGRELPPGFALDGAWLRGETAPVDTWWGPQRQREDLEATPIDWSKRVLLIDEPALPDEQSREELVKRLTAHKAAGGAAVVVTHDISFAREVADDVLLLCSGGVAARCAAPTFFEEPPGPLAARFLVHGNVWPANDGEITALPSHFRWYAPGRLGGMGVPGLMDDVANDLRALQQAGVRTLISLTETPFEHESLKELRIFVRHFAIDDMGVPSITKTASLCRDLARLLDRGERVVVHCRAGLGRTGTIIGAYWVWCGEQPQRAIERVRGICQRCIQNRAQEHFIERFADAVGPPPQSQSLPR